MKLAYKFNSPPSPILSNLCKISNDLYNQTNYIINTELIKNKKWLRYSQLDKILKITPNLQNNINYNLLKAQTSQQILKLIDKNWTSYFKSLKDYKKNPKKYKGKPEPPNYRKRGGENLLIYTNQNSKIEDDFIILSKELKINIPQYEIYKDKVKNYQQIRILPRKGSYEVEIIYKYVVEEDNVILDYSRYGSIDLGVNNLVTLVSDRGAVIYSGKECKSENQYCNKEVSNLKSIRDNKKKEGEKRKWNNRKIGNKYGNRNRFIKDYFHKVSRNIVNYLIINKIGNLVIGVNRGWKDSIQMGKKGNQNFLFLPHAKLIDFIKYKCEIVKISVIEEEEPYTSKLDSIALEDIKKTKRFIGRRIKRGLFKSSIGKLINSDVNGALNILRKVINDCSYIKDIINSGLLFNPIKVRVL